MQHLVIRERALAAIGTLAQLARQLNASVTEVERLADQLDQLVRDIDIADDPDA